MIDRQEHRPGRIIWNQCQAALQGAEHAAFGIGILGEKNIAASLDAGANLTGMLAYHHDYWIADDQEDADKPVKKSFVLKSEQRFRTTHAAGSASGKNDAGD
jgi:hypothetical protein